MKIEKYQKYILIILVNLLIYLLIFFKFNFRAIYKPAILPLETVKNITYSSRVFLNDNQLNRKSKLICVILTSSDTIFNRGKQVCETWGKSCDKLVFALNSQDLYTKLNVTQEQKKFLNEITKLELNHTETYDKMDIKVLNTIRLVYKIYGKSYTWTFLADDDTFIYPNKLLKFIKNHNTSLPYAYGYTFNIIVPNGYHSGGAGILFTQESLKRLHNAIDNNKCNFNHTEGFGDVALGFCYEVANVTCGYSLDSVGREIFHPMDPISHYYGYNTDWLNSYSSHPVRNETDCCSIDSISFHKVEDMYLLIKYADYLDYVKSNFNSTKRV